MRGARTPACRVGSQAGAWWYFATKAMRRDESRAQRAPGTQECVRNECSLRNPRRLQYLCARVKLFERRQSSLLFSPSQLLIEIRLDYITSNRCGKLTEF